MNTLLLSWSKRAYSLFYIYDNYNHVRIFIRVCVKSPGERWRYFQYFCFRIVTKPLCIDTGIFIPESCLFFL